MRTLGRTLLVIGLVAVGYVLGSSQAPKLNTLMAQGQKSGPSKETVDKIRSARQAATDAMDALEQERFYIPAIEGLNSFAATVGGINAIEDLESGRGVDPETFAGLYAGLAVDDVAAKLDKDSDGRLRYNKKIVSLYPISRIKQLFAIRANAVEQDETAEE